MILHNKTILALMLMPSVLTIILGLVLILTKSQAIILAWVLFSLGLVLTLFLIVALAVAIKEENINDY